MKKITALLISLVLAISLGGCFGEDTVTVETESEILSVYKTRETDFEVDGPEVYYYADFEKVYLSQEDGAKYPALKNALDEFNSENTRQWQESVNDLKVFARDMLAMESKALPLEDKNSLSVQRADDKVLSLMTYNYWYSGGAHGYHSHTGVNFDVETGKVLALSDIFTSTDGICEIIVEKLRAKYTDMEFSGLEEIIESAYDNDELSYIVGYQGVTFCFSPYHLGSFADGEQFVTIYYEEYPGLFYEKYTRVPSSYVIGEPVSVDMNGDFSDNEFEAYPTYEGAMYIAVNGQEYRDEDIYFDEADCYLICNEGEYYIYTELSQEDWKISVLYAIGENGIEKVQTLHGTGLGWEDVEGEHCKKIPCDAGDILLKTWDEPLSTDGENKSYFIDAESGILTTNE
ncbi:MAG: DUF4163 domain-containing protein [Clostridia bacterium]|nr:DUF4163 domain-containing protein [Clostridia bacterium]